MLSRRKLCVSKLRLYLADGCKEYLQIRRGILIGTAITPIELYVTWNYPSNGVDDSVRVVVEL